MTHHIRDRPECRLDDEIDQILFDKRFKKRIIISLLISFNKDLPKELLDELNSQKWSVAIMPC